jgi:hypothetical protein
VVKAEGLEGLMAKAASPDSGRVAAFLAAATASAGARQMRTATAPIRFQLVVDGDVVAEAATRVELEHAARRCSSYERVAILSR